jgi:hypothetical protein
MDFPPPLLQRVQTADTHPASYLVDNGVIFPKDKVTGAWGWPLTFI